MYLRDLLTTGCFVAGTLAYPSGLNGRGGCDTGYQGSPPGPPPSPSALSSTPSSASPSAIPPALSPVFPPASQGGKTYIAIGQNYASEWNGFVRGIKVPAGISVYGNIYDGVLTPESQDLLKAYAASHSGFVEIGLSWKDDMTGHGYNLYQGAKVCNDISSGRFDKTLQKLATYLAQYSHVKYLLRVDYEVSGNLHANTNPNSFDSSTFDLRAYPAAFAHIRSLFTQTVSNMRYMFHPVRGSAELLYPGDSLVDFQGFSIFNNDVCLTAGYTQNCAGSRIDPNVLKDIQFARKPKWIAESTPQPPIVRDPKLMVDFLTRVKEMVEKYDFAGWTYINSDWISHSWTAAEWGDTRIDTNSAVKDWFQTNIVSNQRYVFG